MTHAIHQFCVVDMSNFYLDVTKDRMYASSRLVRAPCRTDRDACHPRHADPHAGAGAVLHRRGDLAVPAARGRRQHEESIQLNAWPTVKPERADASLAERWDKLLEVRDVVLKALRGGPQPQEIRQSLQAKVVLTANDGLLAFLRENGR